MSLVVRFETGTGDAPGPACLPDEGRVIPEPDDSAKKPAPGDDPAARQRYLDYREEQLRYDREYLERLRQHQSADAETPAPKPATPDAPWGHPICDECPSRSGCELQRAMKAAAGDELAVARELAHDIDPTEMRCVLAFGMKPQTSLATATKTIIGTSTGPAADDARATLTELLHTLREADVDSATGVQRFLRKIPGAGRHFSETRQAVRAFEQIADHITDLERELRRQQTTLVRDYESLETLHAENADFIAQLEVFIAAGHLKLDELQQQLDAASASAAPSAGDQLATHSPEDLARAIDRLSRRVYDLELTRMMALQTGPQIRLIQDGDERLASKIHTAVLTAIPLWKRQVAMAISLAHQREAVETVKGVTDTTNELLQANSEALKEGTLEVRRETERGVVDIETLQATTDNLISTVEEALRISAEGRAKRAEAEKQIAEMEQQIGSALAEKPDGPAQL